MRLTTLVLSLAVQSDKTQTYVDAITSLPEDQQETLMKTIETVCLVCALCCGELISAGASTGHFLPAT